MRRATWVLGLKVALAAALLLAAGLVLGFAVTGAGLRLVGHLS